MKLLHIIASMDPQLGGVCQAVRTMIAGLAPLNVASEVVSLDAPDSSWGLAEAFPSQLLGPSRGPWGYGASLQPWLRENLARFDVVILHGLWLYQGYAVDKALRHVEAQALGAGAAPRLFIMPHGMLDPYFQRATGRKLKAWRNWLYWKIIEGRLVNEATGVLFTCEAERLLAHEPFAPYHPRRELVVGLGVAEPPPYISAMQEAFRDKCPDLQDRPYLLFLSRIHAKKGVELLVQAYIQLARTLATAALASPVATAALLPALIIAGPGAETAYGQQLQQLAAELPGAAIYFPGMLTGAAKWGAFYGCKAFVLPSHQENFGIAVVEALACAKPVLISNQVNIWREIDQAGGGLVAPDTLAGTHHLLGSWYELPEQEKQAMSSRAKACYHTYFSTKQAAERLCRALR